MTNHPNRSTASKILASGLNIARQIYNSGSVTLIPGDAAHNADVKGRVAAALIAVEASMSAYNESDSPKDVPTYIDAEQFRQNMRDGLASILRRIAE
jgi:hypothetical protein